MSASVDLDAGPARREHPAAPLDRVLAPLHRSSVAVDLVLATLTVVVGTALRFTQDDAFITLRYSRNLAEGNGLVYNLGERVEGYTNFLWTAFLALPFRLDVDPVLWSDVASIAAGVVTVLATRRLARRLLDSDRYATVAALLLVGFHSFAIYLTGGLETQWQTMFVVLVALALVPGLDEPLPVARLTAASAFAGLACLTRLDSAVLLVAIGVPVARALHRRGELGSSRVAAALAPATALLVPWLAWKWGYYDALLPNTFVAKQTPILWAVGRGLFFLVLFVVVTFLFIALPLTRPGWVGLRSRPGTRWALGIVGLWVLYLLYVGADFMEFRFLVPVLPLVMVLVTATLPALPERRELVVIAVIAVGSLAKWALFYPAVVGIESARALEDHVTDPAGWREAGEVLRADFPEGEQDGPTLAITAAGALPFFAQLRTIDMLGLTDVGANEFRWELTKLKAGHEHIATIDYLVEREVDLVIGGVVVEPCEEVADIDRLDVIRRMYLTYDVPPSELPTGSRLVSIPLRSRDRCLLALDLSTGERRDRIDRQGYAELPLDDLRR